MFSHFRILLISTIILTFGFSTTLLNVDFETEGSGYSASATEGTGFTDVFNRSNPDVGGNSSFLWAFEDLSVEDPTLTLNQIDVSGYDSFSFSIDLLAHHFDDWDPTNGEDNLKIYYSLDGGDWQNLMWVLPLSNGTDQYNEPAALDTDFDGEAECDYKLPSLTLGNSGAGCVIDNNLFQTFTASDLALSGNQTLDIKFEFLNFTSTDEGGYLDNVVVSGIINGATCDDESACNFGSVGNCTFAGTNEDCAGNCLDGFTADCNGDCGGTAVADCAGMCDGTSVIGCDSVCGSNAVNDTCGECDGNNSTCTDAPANLFFSEYAEGSSSNKYLEVYNASDAAVSLNDYRWANCSNGCTEWDYVTPFETDATIAAWSTYAVCNPSFAGDLTLCDETASVYVNGDDAVGLTYFTWNNEVLDRVGAMGADPGSGWAVCGEADATKDHTLVRKSSVATGNDNWTESAGTDATDCEWVVNAQNYWDDLGSHTYSPPTTADYTVNSGSYYYNPSTLTVEIGETVEWVNDGGSHDVVVTSGPETFSLPVCAGPCTIGSYTFTLPGTYEYICSVGSHESLGMVGTIIVNSAPVAESCDDGLQNQDETGVDCGGTCSACPPPTYGVDFSGIVASAECTGRVHLTGTMDDGVEGYLGSSTDFTGFGATPDNSYTLSLPDGAWEFIAICIDDTVSEWWNDPFGNSGGNIADCNNVNFMFTVSGADLALDMDLTPDCAVYGCLDSDADNYNSLATAQATDQYGNLLCVYSSCDDVPEAGCMYADSFAAWNEFFGPGNCTTYGGTVCEDSTAGCMDTNADNYDPTATTQAVDQYGNLYCTYLSCDDVPEDGCLYSNATPPSFGAFDLDADTPFDAAACSGYGGTPCESSVAGSSVFITELTDPQNSSTAGRYVELYNNGTSSVNLSSWALQRWTNGNTDPQSPVPLTGTISAGGFYIVCNSATKYNTTYGLTCDQDIGTGGAADSNGDDIISLVDDSGTIVDIYGVPGQDGSLSDGGTSEFEDGRAERVDTVISGNATWDIAEWNIDHDSGGGDGYQNAPEGFDPGVWIGEPAASGCTDASDCDDSNDYTVDSCVDGTCSYVTLDCLVDNDCNDNNDCTVNVCEQDNTCSYQAVTDGGTCDDGDYWTSNDTCAAGVCVGGTLVGYDVTFSVDMNLEGFDSSNDVKVRIATIDGSYDPTDWLVMTDDGSGVFSATMVMPAGEYGYNFNNSVGSGYESGSGMGDTCSDGVSASEEVCCTSGSGTWDQTVGCVGSSNTWGGACAGGNYGNDRFLTVVDANLVLDAVCWESCDECPTVILGCMDSNAYNYDSTATNDDGSCVTTAPDNFTAYINEFHYDNSGGDVDEAVEIVTTSGLSDVELSLVTLTLYNGNGASTYGAPHTLDTFTAGATENGLTYYYKIFPANGIQNGGPDGLAVSGFGVLQFLSYEGVMTAADGPAVGVESTDVGVSESGSDIGTSIQFYGTDGWFSDIPASMGSVNPVLGCLDAAATNYDPLAVAQVYNQYGTSSCTYASCEDTPTYVDASSNTCLWVDGTSSNWWEGPWNCGDGTACGYAKVNFSVSASSSASVVGTFNGWNADSNSLADLDSDGVFDGQVWLLPGDYEYKFVVDGAWEDLSQGLACTVTDDSGQYTNRSLSLSSSDASSDVNLSTVCSGSCYECGFDSCANVSCDSWESCEDPLETGASCECSAGGGDVNANGTTNVSDIVMLVGWIIGCNGVDSCFTAEQTCKGDLTGDTYVNVGDVIALINIILADRISYDDATSANIILTDNSISVDSDGHVSGVQMTLNHGSNFSLDLADSYVSEYNTSGNKTTLIVVSIDGSLEEIATYKGSFEIESTILYNSNNEISDINIVNVNSIEVELAGPNPFNPSTSLNIVVANDGFVSVNVYNLIGQKVATLLNGYMDANLNGYPVNFNGSNLASGVYLVRAETAGNVSTQKLMLLK